MLPLLQLRDPPPPEARATELRRKIASVLVGAPSLPVTLPRVNLTLADVEARAGRIDLRLARAEQSFASLLLEWPEGAPSLAVTIRWDGAQRSRENQLVLDTLAGRLRGAIGADKWAAASALVDELLDLPRDVPMEAFRQLVPGVDGLEALVRTGFGCNQDCGLCWQGRSWGRVRAEHVLGWIEDLRAQGAESLIISGGEPTLDPDLPRYIRRGAELGYFPITLETNAIQCAKAGIAQRLKDAGLHHAFVSLHSPVAAVSDAITRAPGTFVRTIKGIQALLDAGVRVALNAVITTDSIDSVADLPDFIARTFGAHPQLYALVVSDAGDMFEKDLIPRLVPHPDRMREVLPRLVENALAAGITLEGLGNACGPHLCLFGADARVTRIRPIPGPVDFRTYLPECDQCSVKYACLGVRSAHASLYGSACVRPIQTVRER